MLLSLALLLTPGLAACGTGAPGPTTTSIPASPTPLPTATTVVTPAQTATLTPTRQPPAPSPIPSANQEQRARQLRVFDHLWETVRDTYVYPDFNGLDWNGMRQSYEALIKAGMTDEAFYQAMREMIDRLGDEHSAFYSPDEVAAEEAELAGQLDYVGIGIYVTTAPEKNYAAILQVFPDSPAARAGLRSHDRILAVNRVPVVDAQGNDHLDLLLGPDGSDVQITVQTPGKEPLELTLQRAHIQTQLQVEAYRLPASGIGYLLIPTFWDYTIGERVRQALEALMREGDLAGLIIDMRINGGGLQAMLDDTLSLFTAGTLGAFVSRESERPLRVQPHPAGNSQQVPLVILVGRETESFGEIFAGILQEQGRAHIIGRTTAGNVEILWQVDLEDGSRAWIASETFRPPSGTNWEETGIIPQVEIPLDWDEFTSETDPQLQAALDWLQQNPAAPIKATPPDQPYVVYQGHLFFSPVSPMAVRKNK
jgi:carboxyl-terminal processing protease